ncbi:MAG TPA: acetyl-CoA carboxylase biotin carboxylase subunit [Anaerolineae bacterium]|nr:acetyl-CoA carboxylase biotin carboxylase subunit [Anaerolineae bacterium]
MFKKILIANRGEIAVRVMRACKELGIKTVAVYSDADQDSQHKQFADEAIQIESYLHADVLIQAALSSKADAIHPGYGFLSENASFASAVDSAKLTFIGPSADSIRAMGDKAESKILMKKAGVPTVPGYEGLESEDEFRKAAKEIDYPVLIKASAGGGGKGMRIVEEETGLVEAIQGARREALNSFGDEHLLIEKYLADAHHIEFQIFGDTHGHIVHLFERECSVQRRHQKIIEETPSPLLTPEIRTRMGEAAVEAAKAVGYYNAGTVEFIFNPTDSSFYFLEMNTRLQVEHPVTELATGLDLVQWQIRVAAGGHFPYQQDHLSQRGHAIECRIYAEDPANGFLPSTGKLLQFIEPHGPGIRVDSGFRAGDTVTHFYDPMLAKLIVHAENRETAIQKMEAALRDFVVHGVTTNIDFLQDVLSHPDFAEGKVSTRWVEKNMGSGSLFPKDRPQAVGFHTLIAASLADLSTPFGHTAGNRQANTDGRNESDPYNPWKNPGSFRN